MTATQPRTKLTLTNGVPEIVKLQYATGKLRSKPRRGRVHDPRYLAFVAAQPCIVTGQSPVTVHHVRRFGSPKDDYRTVPIVAPLHMLTNETPGLPCVERGKRRFEETWGVSLEAEIRRLNALYWERDA